MNALSPAAPFSCRLDLTPGAGGQFAASLTLTSPPAAVAERGGHHGSPFAEVQAAQAASAALWRELRDRRAALDSRIGPRGAVVGTFTDPDGKAVPLFVGSPAALKKLWRRLPAELHGDRARVMLTVQAACTRWDAEAEREGLKELERRATSARDHARALLERLATAAH